MPLVQESRLWVLHALGFVSLSRRRSGSQPHVRQQTRVLDNGTGLYQYDRPPFYPVQINQLITATSFTIAMKIIVTKKKHTHCWKAVSLLNKPRKFRDHCSIWGSYFKYGGKGLQIFWIRFGGCRGGCRPRSRLMFSWWYAHGGLSS